MENTNNKNNTNPSILITEIIDASYFSLSDNIYLIFSNCHRKVCHKRKLLSKYRIEGNIILTRFA